jgi:hypothetical protein
MEIKEIILFSFTMEMDFLPSHNIGKWLSQQKKKKDTANDVSLSSFGRHYSFL